MAASDGGFVAQVRAAMAAHGVPALSYAVMADGRLVAAEALGLPGHAELDPGAMFQAASISKAVAAYGALLLAERGVLDLDAPIDTMLRRWQVPASPATAVEPVTAARILSMTSGLSVPGFAGYGPGDALPTNLQLLQGVPPANNEPVVPTFVPGSRYAYSGGGFQVLEQAMRDLTDQDFATWMASSMFEPLAMDDSSFDLDARPDLAARAVPGFEADGRAVPGPDGRPGWNRYAALAAAGLWTTPSDLARFALAILQGREGLTARMYLREPASSFGLGLVVNGQGRSLNLRKGGHNRGYVSELVLFPVTGQGAVVMTNSENGERLIDDLLPLFAQNFGWPCAPAPLEEQVAVAEAAC